MAATDRDTAARLASTIGAVLSRWDPAAIGGEALCLALGDRLGAVSNGFSELTAGFRDLQDLSAGDTMAGLAEALAEVRRRLTSLVGDLQAETGHLDALSVLSTGVTDRLDAIRRLVRTIMALALTSKVEVAGVGGDGETVRFALDLVQLAEGARIAICGCEQELSAVNQALDASRSALEYFSNVQVKRVYDVVRQLDDIAEALRAHQGRVNDVNATLASRSNDIEADVGSVVMALQIGDATRQRIEHVVEGLTLSTSIAPVPAPVLIVEAAWLSMHLTQGAGRDFKSALNQIAASLESLVEQSESMLGLVDQIQDRNGGGSTGHIRQVEEKLGLALAEGETAYAAWQRVETLNVAVVDGTTRLNQHVVSLSDATAEMAIVGINAVLKGGRVGVSGRGLAVIADQVRSCARLVVSQVSALAPDLLTLVAQAEDLSALMTARRESLGDGGRQAAGAALSTFDQLGSRTEAALKRLRKLGETSLGGLRASLSQALTQDSADRIETCVNDLGQVLPSSGRNRLAKGSPHESELFDIQEIFAQRYTMDAERTIHQFVISSEAMLVPDDHTPKRAVLRLHGEHETRAPDVSRQVAAAFGGRAEQREQLVSNGRRRLLQSH